MTFNNKTVVSHNRDDAVTGTQKAFEQGPAGPITTSGVSSFDDYCPYNPNKDYEEMMQWIRDNIDSRQGKTEMEGGVNLWMLMYIISMMSDFTASRVARTGAIAEDINDIKNLMNKVNSDLNAGRSNTYDLDIDPNKGQITIDGRTYDLQLNQQTGEWEYNGQAFPTKTTDFVTEVNGNYVPVFKREGNPPSYYYMNENQELKEIGTPGQFNRDVFSKPSGRAEYSPVSWDADRQSFMVQNYSYLNGFEPVSDKAKDALKHVEGTKYYYAMIDGTKYYTSHNHHYNPTKGSFLYGKGSLRDKLHQDLQVVRFRVANSPYFQENPEAAAQVNDHLDAFERTVVGGIWDGGIWVGHMGGKSIHQFWEHADPQYFDPNSKEQGNPGDVQAATQELESVQKQFQAGDSIQQTIIKSQSSLYDTIMGAMNTVNKAMDGMHRTMNQHMGSGT